MSPKSPRWILPATLLAILPLIVLGGFLVQRLVRLNEERYDQEVTAARYAAAIAADRMQLDLRDHFRPWLNSLGMSHMKGPAAFEKTLRKMYYTSPLVEKPQFIQESTLRNPGEPALFAGAEHVCSDAIVAAVRDALFKDGRERMGWVPEKGLFLRPALMGEDEEIKAAPLRWVHVALDGPVARGCPGCMAELEKYGARYDKDQVALLLLVWPLPEGSGVGPGMFGAVVPVAALQREVLSPGLENFNSGDEAMPRHGIRVVDRRGDLILPASTEARVFRTAEALYEQPLLGEGSPWSLEAIALSGFDRAQVQSENMRWLLLMTVAALLLVLGAMAFNRSFRQQVGVTKLRTHLLSNISHELKTPLSLIRLYTETLEAGRARNDEERNKFLRIISRETVRLTHLIDNLLDVQRIEENRKQYSFAQVRPDRVVTTTVETFRLQLAEQGFELRLDLDDDLPLIYLDEEALTQALVNLIDNAAKYSDTRREIRVGCGVSDERLCISVQDRGIGIPVREQEKVFQSFYRVEQGLVHDVKGSGLGLAVVAHVAHAHGGTVQVESKPGAGSTFTLSIPVNFKPEDH